MPVKKKQYTAPKKYTAEELIAASIADWLSDAAHAEHQAEMGPCYPERKITRESLLEYAAYCRAEVEKLKRRC